MQLAGVDLSKKLVQTGSNFGTEQDHDNPFLCSVGSGTMVSSGLSMINLRQSSTSFKVCRLSIGEDNFLGNVIHYPAEGRTGTNCLLATKVMVPTEGEVRENTGLLGSPCFEIPRSVSRDIFFDRVKDPRSREERLRAKNFENLKSMGAYLFAGWLYGCVGLVLAYWTINLYGLYGAVAPLASAAAFTVFSIAFFVLMERWSLGFGRMQPRMCIVLDPYYWTIEHYWRFTETPLKGMFKGTPFRNVLSRLLGIRMGKRVFDDGCVATEKTLVEIGDYCTLNEFSLLLSHSLEDGVFKSDRISVGRGCTVGMNSVVHYGVEMKENAILDADSFLMKGSTAQPDSIWQGNPAREL
jgi:non-ribosomal peptide synthetase-like protein